MPQAVSMPTFPQLVEILDMEQRVVAVMPAQEAARQKLCHRTVAVLLFDEQGRVLLRRNDLGARRQLGTWDVPVCGAVLAGESVFDAAVRFLRSGLGIHAERLRPLLELPPLPENSNEVLQVFGLTRSDNATFSSGREGSEYSFTPEELACLLRDFREMAAPRVHLLAEAMSLKGLWRKRP
ncbi:NUDIX domain-containing protein [Humidesulfovibrio mexicanus]|uniref:NUDIX domain-containing protein n=2 Tax=Humidesulfovibrio mexicanus TaxID=147047 RepID=A0A238XMB1_9BACT|nr:NUDIX domain-containing protein [Humidesulfovibrio mexicanus]